MSSYSSGTGSARSTSNLTGDGLANSLWSGNSTNDSSNQGDFDEIPADMESDVLPLITEIQDEHPTKWSTTLFDLGAENYILKSPLTILVEEYSSGDVVARLPEMEVDGLGCTDAEAIQNLKLEILDLYDELTECDPSELGNLPSMWLRILKKIIEKQ